MKIKCPGCATLLQIPESAAGKVVKCKCGKQLRAPTPKGAPAPATSNAAPGATSPAAPAKPLGATPTRSPAPAASPGIFDELTDTDLAPIKAVQMPGAKVAVKPPSASANKTLQEAIAGADRRSEGMLMKGEAPRPPFLIFLGVVNWMAAAYCCGLMFLMFGMINIGMEALEGRVPELAGTVLYLLAGLMGVEALLSAATGVACFMRGKFFWYVVLVSYGWSLGAHIFDLINYATSEEADMGVVFDAGKCFFAAAIWVWLHGESVRDYYGIRQEPLWRIIVIDLSGFLIAGGLGVAILLLQ